MKGKTMKYDLDQIIEFMRIESKSKYISKKHREIAEKWIQEIPG